MTERQLERIENQNKIFLSESDASEDSSEEEKNHASRKNSTMVNSFDDSDRNNRSRTSDNQNTRTNTTAKSNDSGLE